MVKAQISVGNFISSGWDERVPETPPIEGANLETRMHQNYLGGYLHESLGPVWTLECDLEKLIEISQRPGIYVSISHGHTTIHVDTGPERSFPEGNAFPD